MVAIKVGMEKRLLSTILLFSFAELLDEMVQQLSKKFCQGCKVEHGSQHKHECLMDSELDKLEKHFDQAFCEFKYSHILGKYRENVRTLTLENSVVLNFFILHVLFMDTLRSEKMKSQSTISWNKHGKVKINNETVPNSHIVDLLRDVVIPYGCKQLPSGHEIFYDFLKNIHIPMGLISNRMRKQLVQSDIQTTEENEQLAESEPEKNKKRKINKLFVRRELSRLFEEKPKLKWKRFKL
ncbi:Hypothetical predicted protein [Mytilus galloprovincialis]|uniref:Uncharacterized protein n=1 Tax=Mytilus galloprovincialis TaxID=29158 RepID=A0A8B6BY95_MYTGA|nr:Hypothetical predicted protein [Mytilus galloprovincialis]